MFCDQCGSPLQAGQSFCSGCGKGIVQGMQWSQPRPGRVREHVRLLGILWLALSAFNAIGGVVLLIIANTIFAREIGGPSGPPHFLRTLLTFIGFVILAKAAVGFVAGWGLLQSLPWGRVVALVLGFISLFNIPLGTVLGIYTLWVLLPAESEGEYERQAQLQTRAA